MSAAGALWRLTGTELAAAYRAGEANPEEALRDVLARIEDVNPRLNAIVTLDAAGAREAAAASTVRFREGRPLGPLDGVPATVKDNLFVGGLRATWGSLLFADHLAPRDDLAIAKLRGAGAVILGKTNTPELALSGYTDNRLFGPTGNPWAPDLSPGGSSGGAVAAVGSGCGCLALATDAGGSIRRPAGHAGVAGLKPGLGRVPRRHGFPPLAHDLQVVGPIARSVADLRALFELIATPAPGEPEARRRLRIGAFGTIGTVPIDPEVAAAFARSCAVLRDLGHAVEEIAPLWDPDEVGRLFGALASVGVARVVAGFEGLEERVTPAIRQQAEAGAKRSAADYVADLDRLAAFRFALGDAVAGLDAVATPASPALPWPRGEPFPKVIAGREAGPRDAAAFSTAVNLAGLPAIVVPAPTAGLPAGLQLIGPMQSEERLLDLAAAFETASPWPQLAPI